MSTPPPPPAASDSVSVHGARALAHDLNNLLGTILGNLHLARLRVAQGTCPVAHLDRIEGSTERAVDLCRRLGAMGRGLPEAQERTDLNGLVRDLALALEVRLAPGQHLELDLAPSLPKLQAQRGLLQQGILNLLLNAIEAHQGRPGRIQVRTSHTLSQLLLEVQDEGCGMSEDVRSRILEPRFSTKGEGRGWGLSVLPELLAQHQGSLEVESAPGRGTRFRLWLGENL